MTEQNARPRPKGREAYRHFTAFATRWRDNDQYGHMNNAVYYELFDSAVNKFLIDSGILALTGDKTQFLVASSGCDYFTDVAYPIDVDVGLRCAALVKVRLLMMSVCFWPMLISPRQQVIVGR